MDRSHRLKDLRDEIFNHVSDNPLDVASFELWLKKRHHNEDANLKALHEFTKTARELGVTVSSEPLEFPRYYVLSIETTLKALDTLAKTNHDIEDFVPRQHIQIIGACYGQR